VTGVEGGINVQLRKDVVGPQTARQRRSLQVPPPFPSPALPHAAPRSTVLPPYTVIGIDDMAITGIWALSVVSDERHTHGVNSVLHPSAVTKSCTTFGWGKGGNVTSVGWQVTLRDPMRHASSRSGEASC